MSLLDDVKNILDITSTENDVTTLNKLNLIIANGKQHLRSFYPTLTDNDFSEDKKSAKFLLLNFCRYAYSNATEMFDVNFRKELLAFRQEYEVSEYENQNTD